VPDDTNGPDNLNGLSRPDDLVGPSRANNLDGSGGWVNELDGTLSARMGRQADHACLDRRANPA